MTYQIRDPKFVYNALGGYKQKLEEIAEKEGKKEPISFVDRGMYERMFGRTIVLAKEYGMDMDCFDRWWNNYKSRRVNKA